MRILADGRDGRELCLGFIEVPRWKTSGSLLLGVSEHLSSFTRPLHLKLRSKSRSDTMCDGESTLAPLAQDW